MLDSFLRGSDAGLDITGPRPAIHKALGRTGLALADIESSLGGGERLRSHARAAEVRCYGPPSPARSGLLRRPQVTPATAPDRVRRWLAG